MTRQRMSFCEVLALPLRIMFHRRYGPGAVRVDFESVLKALRPPWSGRSSWRFQ